MCIRDSFQYFGLVLFIFTIGIQAGPGFFESFKKEGRKLAQFATLLVLVAGLITVASIYLLEIDKSIAIGLLAGALTSTPGLAAAIDLTGSPLASIGYGVAYPLGVIGVILFIRFLPKIIGASVKQSEEEYQAGLKEEFPEIIRQNFLVENENVVGKSIGELRIRLMTKAMVRCV